MPLRLRYPMIVLASLLVLTAGCRCCCYGLRADRDMVPMVPDEEAAPAVEAPLQIDPPRLSHKIAEAQLLSPLNVSVGAMKDAEAVADGRRQDAELDPPPVRPASLQQAEELPTPPQGESDEQEIVAEELPAPDPSPAAAELIVVPIQPRRLYHQPLRRLKRLLRSPWDGHCDTVAECETCAMYGDAAPLSLETPLFSPSGEVVAPNHWWTSFGNPALDRQIEYSLGGSFTLAAALQRLRAAEALARREASDLWPDVNAIIEGDRTFRSYAPDDGSLELGLEASYQVDLWGQIKSRADAEQLRASATAEDYHAVALTLTAEIARNWFLLVEAHAQMQVLEEQLETNLTGVELLETRFGGGDERVGSADVLRQRQLAESTREQIIVVRSRIDVLEHRLAVLQGRPPQGAAYDVGNELPTLPPLPATGLPSELLQRRPDVRRDYLAILAADRDLASAITAQYPRLNLAGSLTTIADDPANLFRDWMLMIAAQVVAPLIDGGERRAEVDRTYAVLYQLVSDYGQTVLIAFSEVEDALALERYQRERVASLDKQNALARQAAEELRERYFFGEEIGRTDYLDVLTATTTEQQLQRDILSARLDLILTRISLYLALAGSFGPHPQVPGEDGPPHCESDERPPAAAIISPLDSDPDLGRRLLMHSRRGSGGHRGDQSNRADRTATRGDSQIGGAR